MKEKNGKNIKSVAERMCKSTMEKRFTIYILILTGIVLGISRSSVRATDSESPVFTASEITEGDEVYNRINGRSYQANENISLGDLRYLQISHYDFDHKIQTGELIVNAELADEVLEIFQELYDAEYEIASMHLIDDYWVNEDPDQADTNSIDHNNTSAFCYRVVTGGENLSRHAYGCAIDINPQQNPYLTLQEDGTYDCDHENAQEYMDRSLEDAHEIKEGDVCWQAFTDHGFTWGGDWTNPKDYQHFEKRLD